MEEFAFKCVSCNQTTFTVNTASIGLRQGAPVVTFICPKCGEYNGVQERPGGGLLVTVDKHAKHEGSG